MGIRIKMGIFGNCLLVGLVSAASVASAEPVKYSPSDNAFEVTFPAKPECKTQELKVATGKVVMHVCWHAQAGSQLTYSVTFCDGLPAPQHTNYAAILQESMNGVATATSSSIVKYRSLEIGGFPALESVMRDQNGVMSLSRYVLANQRVFSIEFNGWREGAAMEGANDFMNSFKINVDQ